jgi:TatA/E family protein of Tat protein translocase
MFGIGTNELIIIFLIILLLFGASRIPEVGRALGRGIRDFKRATKDIEDDIRIDDDPPRPRSISERSEGETNQTTGTKAKERTT